MSVRKVTISLDPGLYEAARADAKRKGMTVSSWIAEASEERLRQQALSEYLDAYQQEFGAFTAEELSEPIAPTYVSGQRKEAS